MAIVCPQRYNSSFAPHQTTHHVGIMHSSSKRYSQRLFYIYTGATHHMTSNPAAFVSSSPYQGKKKCRLHRWPHPTLYFISDIGTISLSSRFGNVLHLNDAMLVPKVSLSKNCFGWTTLWWLPKLCYLYSDFLCVVKDLHTHNVIAIGCRPQPTYIRFRPWFSSEFFVASS